MLFVVSWDTDSRIMEAKDMETLWKRIKKNYFKGSHVLIETADEKKVFVKEMIVHNRIRCKICGDVIESEYTHDWKHCECGACSIDGGKAYLRRGGDKKNWEELSEIKEDNENADLG